MIRTYTLDCHAANPQMPLEPVCPYTGSAATFILVNLPRPHGKQRIDAVTLSITNADAAVSAHPATREGSSWIVTVPAAAIGPAGNVKEAIIISASGVDEQNRPVSSWIVAVADLRVKNQDGTAVPGEPRVLISWFDSRPANPRGVFICPSPEGQAALDLYDGHNYRPLDGGGVTVDDTVTRTSANPVKSSGIWSAIWGALTALPTGFTSLYDWCVAKLAEKRDKADRAVYSVMRTENTDWTWTSGTPELSEELNDANVKLVYNSNGGYWTPNPLSTASFIYDSVSHYGSKDDLEVVNLLYTDLDHSRAFYATATRPRYMDETLGPAKTNQQLAAVATDDAAKPADGSLMKYDAANDRFVKAFEGVDYLKTHQDISGKMDKVFTPLGGFLIADENGNARPSSLVDEVTIGEIQSSLQNKADRATTLSGYGITDAANLSDIIDPALAAAVGKIADAKLARDFVNLMVSTNSAHYLTARSGTAGAYTYPPFASATALRAALASHTAQNPQFFYAGEAFTPTKNDWAIVAEDEDHPLGTIVPASRYGFVGTFGSGGSFQYQVSYKLPLTTAQIAALDSEITKALVLWLTQFKGTDTATTLASVLSKLAHLESDGTADDTFATDLLGKQVAKEALMIPLEEKTDSFTAEDGHAYAVTMTGTVTITMPTTTEGKAAIFQARFSAAAQQSVQFDTDDVVKFDGTDCGIVKAGKDALLSAMWNGEAWDLVWKNQA